MFTHYKNTVQEGDLVELAGPRHKSDIFILIRGETLQTHRGIIKHDDLIGKPWGSQVISHLGKPFILFRPSLNSLILNTKRNTQILYPKDIGFIQVTMGIGPGINIIEAGTGSGGLTQALAFAVGKNGHVYTYEIRPEMHKLAKDNLSLIKLGDRVTFKLKDIRNGFDEKNVDAVFLDLPNPYDYIAQVREALKLGGAFGAILPTVNQVIKLLIELNRNSFSFIEVCEILLRYFKPEATRLRPTDRMVAHTGYLIFAKSIELIDNK
ncbi:MAG TPA: tRNA (adenine-N1)-methyltransferase [Anaerolineae bacterium]|nr:tRNA (adenine-N1)-methyltransferase [Anaerolineae bacterium]